MKQYVISLALLIATLVAFPTSHANAQSQAEMNRQAAKDFEKVDAESQPAWLAFRDAEAAFAGDQARGGSMAPAIRYETMTELTQQRIKQLETRLTE